MATKSSPDRAGVSQEQLDLIQQFEADYNAIDHFLRKAFPVEALASFAHLVNEYSRRHRGWKDADLLRTIADVRNAIVHGKVEPYGYVAVPTLAIVQNLKLCRERLMNPVRVIPKFQRPVDTITVEASLGKVLKTVAEKAYSQFPAYGSEGFQGLVTENGITRWLAHHVDTNISLVDLDDISVKEVLQNEEDRQTWQFVPRDMRVDDVSGLFGAHPTLEAVLITESGKKSEALLGIVTRSDIIQLA